MYNAPAPRPGRAFDRRDPSFFKTRLCTQHAAGACRYGDKCTYAHGEAELRPSVESGAAAAVTAAAQSSGVPTSRVCFRWATAGACVHGARCHFQHVLAGAPAAMPAAAAGGAAPAVAGAAPPAPTATLPPLRPVGGGAAVAANRARAACAALGVGGAASAGVPADAVGAVFAAAAAGGNLLAPTPWADDGRPYVAAG